jgi:hypothetical protein
MADPVDYSKLSDEELQTMYAKMLREQKLPGKDIDWSKLSDKELIDQYANYKNRKLPVMEDVARSAGTGILKAGTGMLTAVPDMMDLAKRGSQWVGEKAATGLGLDVDPKLGVDPEAEANTNIPLTNAAVNQYIENKFPGVFHNPQTAVGSALEKGIEYVTPSMVGGGGSALGKALRGVGAAIGGEGGRALADATGLEDYAPAASMAGALLGYKMPRKLVTPSNIDPVRLANAQRVQNAGVNLSAGRFTDTPFTKRMESNIQNWGGTPTKFQPEAQAEQATQSLRNIGGVTGPGIDNLQDIKSAKADAAAQYNQMLGSARANYDPEFEDRLLEIRRDLGNRLSARTPGVGQPKGQLLQNSQGQNIQTMRDPRTPIAGFEEALKDIKHGPDMPNGNPPPPNQAVGMSGNFYDSTRERLGKAIDAAENPNIARALRHTRDALDDWWERTVPPQYQGQATQFRRQWSDLSALEGAAGAPGQKAAAGTLSPSRVFQEHVNKGGDLAQTARSMEALGVGKDIPKTSAWGYGPWSSAAGTIAGILAGRLSHVPGEEFTGGILGLSASPIVNQIAAKALAKPYYSGAIQDYLKNQRWPANQSQATAQLLWGQGAKFPLPAIMAPQLSAPGPEE